MTHDARELLGIGDVAGDSGQRRPDTVRPASTRSPARTAGAGEDAAAVRRARSSSDPLRAPNAPQSYFAERADRRRARVRGEHGPGRVPQAEHRRHDRRPARAGCRCSTRPRRHAGWKPKVAALEPRRGRRRDRPRLRRSARSRARRSAMVADIEVDKKTGKIVAKHLYISQNNGITISPDLVANQMSGAAIQGLSRALYEQAPVHEGADHEPRLGHVPDPPLQGQPEGHARQRPPGQATRSSSRATSTDVRRERGQHRRVQRRLEPRPARASRRRRRSAAAVANAFFDATGVRIRQAPMNPDRASARRSRPPGFKPSNPSRTTAGGPPGPPHRALAETMSVPSSVPRLPPSPSRAGARARARAGLAGGYPSLYANYASNCTFASSTTAARRSRASRPAPTSSSSSRRSRSRNGLAACETIQFHLTGPGLNFETDLGSGDAEIEQHTVTLQPGGTYTVQDDGRPAQTRRTFTVATSGLGDAGTSTRVHGHRASSSSTKAARRRRIRSARKALPSAARSRRPSRRTGKLTPDEGGEARLDAEVGPLHLPRRRRLGQGRLHVQLVKGPPTTLSTPKFTGTRSVTLTLAPRAVVFFTPGGAKHFFVVTK